jgi:hypothetical protein
MHSVVVFRIKHSEEGRPTVLFTERPITVQHIRDFCARFNEGIRVEYKSTFDRNVREALPKIVSSFANSQGGVLVIGVNAPNGVPQPPFNGFAPQPREELPLTVENICLQNINPPVLPKPTVVPSDTPGQVFLVIEVEESGEAPHAIENSRKVFVRTGNAGHPYEFAEVDLIIDLVKRRSERLDLRERLLKNTEQRAGRNLPTGAPFFQISICPTFPRTPISSSQDVWDFLQGTPYRGQTLAPLLTMRRIPEGVGCLVTPKLFPVHYLELNKFGLLLLRSLFSEIPFYESSHKQQPQQLHFRDLFHSLFKLTVCAERFYRARGFRGSLLIRTSLHDVMGRPMRFLPAHHLSDYTPEDFRCQTDIVSVERLTDADLIGAQSLDVLIDILSELTWPFWQLHREYPSDELQAYLERTVKEMGRI